MASIFCDTSVLVAALDARHPQHGPCIALLSNARAGHAYCALHSYAEFYSIMSGKPSKPRLRPADVNAMIDRLDRVFTPITLNRREHRAVLSRIADSGVAGGRTYDALILECAIKSGATAIYTLNDSDFRALAPAEFIDRLRRP